MKRRPIHMRRADGGAFCGQRPGGKNPLLITTDLTEATCGRCHERLETGGRLLPRIEQPEPESTP